MQHQIFIFFNLKLIEPGAFITDVFIAIAGLIFYIKIKKLAPIEKEYLYFRYFFLFMGISTLVAAFAHLFYLYAGKNLHLIAWVFTALSTYFFDRAVLINWKNKIVKNTIWHFINIQFLVFLVLISWYKNFDIVTANTVLSLLIIAVPILFVLFFKQNQKGNILIITGILSSAIPALIFKSPYKFMNFLTAKDISHLIIAVCLFYIYLGIKRNYEIEKQ
ncbi:MAG: hypothetical protein JXR51_08745 [Bacteroidales bacterium]|nr:hypothetical protein [Bacteroidales bacterium]MBN2757251.1 hypothetical protein [Bacteroidales bacterium]